MLFLFLQENIILFDPDIETDYPLEEAIGFLIPPGFQFIRVQQIPREQMPLLLERAKVRYSVVLSVPGMLERMNEIVHVLLDHTGFSDAWGRKNNHGRYFGWSSSHHIRQVSES